MSRHPLHAALSDFPVVFLCSAPVCDLIGWSVAAFYLAIAAVVAAIPTMATGAWELARLTHPHPVTRLILWHAGFMGSAVIVESVSLVVRHNSHTCAVVLEITAAALVIAGGWCGGHLVFVHGVGRAAPRANDA